MASIADTFLADFESSGDEEEEEGQEEEEDKDKIKKEKKDKDKEDEVEPEVLPEPDVLDETEVNDLDVTMGLVEADGEPAKPKNVEEDVKIKTEEDTVAAVSVLLNDSELKTHLEKIANLMASTENEMGIHLNVDREEEYDVIVRSNELAVEIDNEIATIHKYIRDIYSTKYHELEQLVPNPLEYSQVVKVIGNETDMSLVEKELAGIVPNHTILTILVTATTTIGKPLPAEELKKVFDAADAIIKLDEAKKKLFEYVESRMTFIAPNLTALVGAEIAARLMAAAGGLRNISEIPSCNLQVLGKKQKNLAGFSTQANSFHMGLLAQVDIISSCPPSLRQRALRLLAGKCTLAARCDSHQDQTGEVGRRFREEIEGRVHKWQEPPPPKPPKPLPVPLPPPRKKRGGKRYRKQKELYKTTELQKQKNKMPFGLKAEVVDEFTGEGFGMLGQAGGGRLAVKKENKQKLSQKLSRKTQAKLRRVKTASSGTSGIASSIAFTPVQGIELVDREALDKKQKEAMANKYFSTTSGFFRVGSATKRKLEEDRLEKIRKEAIKQQKIEKEKQKPKKKHGHGIVDKEEEPKRKHSDKDLEIERKIAPISNVNT